MIIIYILLAVIAYFLYRIYRQKEDEKQTIADEKHDAEWQARQKEKFKDYPNLFGKVPSNWIEVFANHVKTPGNLLKMMFYLMIGESVKIDYSEGSKKYDSLWDCTKELLEHLEKYHEGSTAEHEIALCIYWQFSAEAMGTLVKESPEKTVTDKGRDYAPVEGKKVEAEPFTNIEKIAGFFPKKANHPTKEITFFNSDGSFPRESKGSLVIDKKIEALGI